MKSGGFIPVRLIRLVMVAVLVAGCTPGGGTDTPSDSAVSIPHGYMPRLEQILDGKMIGFGPFVGYYFRPEDPEDLSRLRFVCFNENQFYSSDMADGAKLFEGTAMRKTLPKADIDIPTRDRINPVFFEDAPAAWHAARPEPKESFLHFHSCYDGTGPVRTGYWIRHIAVADFTYDMGGRVDKESPLYHQVQKGPDREFARIIEFDKGPKPDAAKED